MAEDRGNGGARGDDRPAAPAAAPPRWMKRGTIWTIIALATGGLLLIAYYLLPLWWAGVIAGWVAGSNAWVTGLLLGGVLFLASVIGGRIALRIADGDGTVRGAMRARKTAKSTREAAEEIASTHGLTLTAPSRGWKGYARLAFTIVTGASLAALLLTVAIAIGFTQPLRQARAVWREHSPGLLSATLVGVLIAIIILVAVGYLRQRRRVSTLESAPPPAPEGPGPGVPAEEDPQA